MPSRLPPRFSIELGQPAPRNPRLPPTIVLVNPPGRRLYQRDWYDGCVAKGHYLWPPLNLLVQSGFLARVARVQVVDGMAERLTHEQALERVASHAPDVVVLLTGSASWEEDLSFAREARRRTGARLVGHGDAFTFEPRQALERWPFVDAAFYDFTSPGLAEWVASGRGSELRFPDVMHRGAPATTSNASDAIVEGPWRRAKEELDYPLPRHELFPLARYRMPFGPVEPLSAMLTNYGCPHTCEFCNKPSLGFRLRPLDAVSEELAALASLGIERLFVADMTFNVSRARVHEVCERFARAPARFRFSAYARPDGFDVEQARVMKRAGAIAIHFGVESGDERVLADNGKPMSVARVEDAFRACRREGILAGAHFLLGLPGETREGLERTVSLARNLEPDFAAVNLVMPRMGTRLRARLGTALDGTFTTLDSSGRSQPVATSPVRPRELERGRRRLMRALYFHPRSVARQVGRLRTWAEAANLLRNGYTVLRSYAT